MFEKITKSFQEDPMYIMWPDIPPDALSTEHAEYIKVNIDTWFCKNCNSSLFPFNHVENEIDFHSYVADMLHCNKMSLSYLSDKLFLPF